MLKKIVILLGIFFFLKCVPVVQAEESTFTDNTINDINLTVNLKTDPDVHLNDLNYISTRLYVLEDKENNYYFCLDEVLYYPNGNVGYEVSDNSDVSAPVFWLLKNFYSNLENNDSIIADFKNENFKTQYAATQIAIWNYTNPDLYKENKNGKKVIDSNPLIQNLIEEAAKNQVVGSYETDKKALDEISMSLSDIQEEGKKDDFYIFSANIIIDNLVAPFFIDNEMIDVSLTFANETTTLDITDQSVISIDKETQQVTFKVPESLMEEHTDDKTLMLKVTVTIQSDQDYYLSMTPIGTNKYQPLATKNKLKKNITDLKSISVEGKTSFTVLKQWNDNNNQDGVRPELVNVQLYASGRPYGDPVTLTSSNSWQATWDNLPLKDEQGTLIEYTVQEIEEINSYISTINQKTSQLATITNTYVPEQLNISGNKVWDDNNNQDNTRPTVIYVHLLANGIEIAVLPVSEEDDWLFSFDGLPKYEDGKEILYTVIEETVPNYTTEIDGTTIINRHQLEKTNVTVTKAWEDNNNKEKKRPNQIMVQLYADGVKQGEPVELNDSNQWTYTWSGLDEKNDGKTIVYDVEEVTSVTNYSLTKNDSIAGNIILTNTYHTSVEPVDKEDTNSFPSTGEKNSHLFIFAGILCMILFGSIFIKKNI